MRVRASVAALAAAVLVGGLFAVPAGATGPRVLRVGTYKGIAGQHVTIQGAVNAANPGDWILVGPGDYRTSGSKPDGVTITTRGLHLRGMNRNTVVVDGTRPGAPKCSPAPGDQTFGPLSNGDHQGRNGIQVFEVNGVSVENLTVCNFLSSPGGDNGNEVWFNGGDGTGQQDLGAWTGRYLSATSTYFKDSNSPMAQYGLFGSNSYGPGLLAHSWAGNMGDSAIYIGACPDCNTVVNDIHATNSALGYSGTNAGGHLILENSEWDHNLSGIVPNSLNNDDAPPPQDGHCPDGQTGPTGTPSCTIIEGNYVHDNNNPNVPTFGIAGVAPVGTGIEDVGGSNDTIVGNRVVHNGSWGIIIHDYPDTEQPPPVSHCEGGVQVTPELCLFLAEGNEVAANVMDGNGFFGNPGNVDLANEASNAVPGNCFHDNTTPTGGVPTSDPADIQTVDGTCGGPAPGDASLALQLVCASDVLGSFGSPTGCPEIPGTTYPRRTKVKLLAMPLQPTMPNACAGVPVNPWCPSGSSSSVPIAAGPAIGLLAAAPVRRLLTRR